MSFCRLPGDGRPRRFGALRTGLDGVSPKVLTATLRRLEEHGLIDRATDRRV
jgi:DNA-binding HxlR family transcriptional regulator